MADDPGDLLDSAAYERGALALHALRAQVGDTAFFDILRQYTQRFRHGAASTADFIALAEEVAGSGPGRPVRRLALH